MRFYSPNYDIYQNAHEDRHKGICTGAVEKGIPHKYKDLPSLFQ
jgi:hypothetical protein